MPATYANAVTPPGAGGSPTAFPPPYGYVAAYAHHTSYTEQYLLNVQRQLGSNWAFEVGYLGSESHHLYGFQNANEGIPGTVGSAISRLPFADFGVIQLVADGVNAGLQLPVLQGHQAFQPGHERHQQLHLVQIAR